MARTPGATNASIEEIVRFEEYLKDGMTVKAAAEAIGRNARWGYGMVQRRGLTHGRIRRSNAQVTPTDWGAKRAQAARDYGKWSPTPQTEKKMETVLGHLRIGKSVRQASAEVGVTEATYTYWRSRSPWFKTESDRAKAKGRDTGPKPPLPFTPESRAKYFKADYDTEPITPPHLEKCMELINSLQPGEFGLILLPPGHAKTTIGEDWLSCAIADDPETRAVVISKTQSEAQKRLLKIQARMEDFDFYQEFIEDYGPFRPDGRSQRPWAATKMTVARKSPRQRDYSLQAIGIGGQIQGQRIDKGLLDDIEDDQNFREYEKHAMYIRQSVNTRLDGGKGIGLMIGTRQDETDIYRYLIDEDFFDKVLILPAVDIDGTLLWEARFSRDDYARMERKAGPRTWALVYQQQDVVQEGMTFPRDMLYACLKKDLLAQHVPEGSIPVVGIDPSVSGYTAGFCIGVNPKTKMRTWVDAWNEKNLTGDGGDRIPGLVQFIVGMVEFYKARICCLEANSAFALLSSSLVLRSKLAELGCRIKLVESTFSGLKIAGGDAIKDLGIAQMSALFANGLIEIPTAAGGQTVFKEALRQFERWRPGDRKLVKDLVKAFQFSEAAARDIISREQSSKKPDVSFLPPHLQRLQGNNALPPHLRKDLVNA
jgi:hypothetical protein